MELGNRHVGQTAIIVGCGTSIVNLRPNDFPSGIVIAINHSITVVRALKLPNLVYSMQKVGCVYHHYGDVPIPITTCVCPSPQMVQPVEPEELILSTAESAHCFADYPLRHIVDVQREFHTGWSTASAEVSVMLAAAMGCTSILMLGHDAYTMSDAGRFVADPLNADREPLRGYVQSGSNAQAAADKLGLPVVWR